MAREWIVTCKSCGETFGYSGRSYEKMLEYGHSRPEYCKNCQASERKKRAYMSVSYFSLSPNPEIDFSYAISGDLGSISQGERVHTFVDNPSSFDPKKYGITEQDVHKLADWFSDSAHQVAVVVGETGSGKSTALPWYLTEPPKGIPRDQFMKNGQIIITQPRIVATEKIAVHLGGDLIGSSIGSGFDIGFQHSKNPNTDWRNAIVMMTDGSLINMIESGKLGGIGIVMIDEAHERSLNIDVILRLLKQYLPQYPHLKLIIASATIDADKFANYFGRHTATVIEFAGIKQYGYTGPFFQNESEALPYDTISRLKPIIPEKLAAKMLWLIEEMNAGRKPVGDILGFMYGVESIKQSLEILQAKLAGKRLKFNVNLLPLHAKLPDTKIDEATNANTDPNLIRGIIATNMAEASVTVDGVVYVVETGLVNQSQWDSATSTQRIVTVVTSRANAKQRWGRCGRTRQGEVHCLYTEKQFIELMPEYPVPEIQRSGMEQPVLTGISSGINSLADGWIDQPPIEEIRRSVNILRTKGVIDEQNRITEYGEIIRYLPFPTEISDLILLADRFGCLREMVILALILKNGGLKNLLVWDKDWEPYTKRTIGKIHKSLMAGCRDDIEFCLKLYASWMQAPWAYTETFDYSYWEQEGCHEWAVQHFINEETLVTIFKEQKSIIDNFTRHTKTEGFREVDFTLIDRVRLILMFGLKGNGITRITEKTQYFFNRRAEPEKGSSMNVSVYFPENWEDIYKSLINPEVTSPIYLSSLINSVEDFTSSIEPIDKVLSRLFAEQAFPVGTLYNATFGDSGYLISFNVAKPRSFIQATYNDGTTWLNDFEGQTYGQSDLNDQIVVYGKLEESSHATFPAHQSILVEAIGYDIFGEAIPYCIFRPVNASDSFASFTASYKTGQLIKVRVEEYDVYPGDFRPSLVVRELKSNLEILIEPEELAFNASSEAIQCFPIGAMPTFMIDWIDSKQKHVHLTMLPMAQSAIEEMLSEQVTEEDTIWKAEARMLSVRSNNTIVFALNTPVEKYGILATVIASENSFCKPINQFQVGEPYFLDIYVKNNKNPTAELSSLPPDVQRILYKGDEYLTWEDGKLEFTGRMSYEQMVHYQNYSADRAYADAIERIFRYSNQFWVARMIDQEWLTFVETYYPTGTTLNNLVITETAANGTFSEVQQGLKAFIPNSLKTAKLTKGKTLRRAVVIDIDVRNRLLILDATSYLNSIPDPNTFDFGS